MDQYLLRYFLAVAELGNFGRAADRVNISQPTLSAGIAKLEALLGVRLFDRDKRPVVLTAAGSRFLIHAQRIANEFDLAMQEVRNAPEATTMRVGVLTTIPTRVVEDIAVRHRLGARNETLEILDGSEREIIERLDRGRLDLAVSVIRPNHERFRPETLRRERYLMVLPGGHALADATVLRAEELAGDRMIVRRHCEALPEVNRHFTGRGVRPRFVLKTTSDERALAMVNAGQGVALMPESFGHSGVRFVRIADFDLSREVGILFAGHMDVGKSSSPFLRLLREQYGTP